MQHKLLAAFVASIEIQVFKLWEVRIQMKTHNYWVLFEKSSKLLQIKCFVS